LSCIRSLLPILLVLVPALTPVLRAQSGEEEAEYRILSALRDQARDAGREDPVRAFDNEAQRFLRRYPGGRHASVVELWRGDLLKGIDDRQAFLAYRRSREPEAAGRARDVAFRHEAPPPLEVDRWVGPACDVVARSGRVTALVFFSESHPVTDRLLPRLQQIQSRLQPRGLDVIGVAAVLDDHANQRPELLAARLGGDSPSFPIAIDRQRPGGLRSVSLERYRGGLVPWCALIDRYGRIAWLEGLTLQGNAITALERELDRLVSQPTAEELAKRVREGDVESLERLASIRTPTAAAALLECLDSKYDAQVRTALADLLPDGWNPANTGTEALRTRWQTESDKLHYSFEHDRLAYGAR